MKKIAIFSAPKTGTHLLTLSLSKSLKIPYCLDANYSSKNPIPIHEDSWVIASHNKYTDEISSNLLKKNVFIIGTSRNILDHVLSLTGYPENCNSKDYLDKIKSEWLIEIRNNMKRVPEENIINYDNIVSNDLEKQNIELFKLSRIIEHDQTIEIINKDKIYNSYGNSVVNIGIPGTWKNFFSKKVALEICNFFNEELPE